MKASDFEGKTVQSIGMDCDNIVISFTDGSVLDVDIVEGDCGAILEIDEFYSVVTGRW